MSYDLHDKCHFHELQYRCKIISESSEKPNSKGAKAPIRMENRNEHTDFCMRKSQTELTGMAEEAIGVFVGRRRELTRCADFGAPSLPVV